MIGISLSYLPGKDIQEVSRTFLSLQAEFRLEACELQMECNQFPSAFCQADDHVHAEISKLRERVHIMGIHLPYLDLNPISDNPLVAQFAMKIQRQAINTAALMNADYVVFHARGSQARQGDRQTEMARWRYTAAELGGDCPNQRDCFLL